MAARLDLDPLQRWATPVSLAEWFQSPARDRKVRVAQRQNAATCLPCAPQKAEAGSQPAISRASPLAPLQKSPQKTQARCEYPGPTRRPTPRESPKTIKTKTPQRPATGCSIEIPDCATWPPQTTRPARQ